MIAAITLGANLLPISKRLQSLLPNKTILLGCTEFSYLHEKHPIRKGKIYDPNIIAAEELAKAYFLDVARNQTSQ